MDTFSELIHGDTATPTAAPTPEAKEGGASSPAGDGATLAPSPAPSPAPQGSRETFLLFVGSKSSGKSTLINKFLNPNKKDKPKPTVAMEYTFGRRSSGNGKDIAHIWELGGGKKLSDLVSVPLTQERLASLVTVVVLDLSVPSKVLQTALWWIDLVRVRVRESLEQARRTRPGQRIADFVTRQSRARLSPSHADANDVDLCPVPLVLLANKYDLFSNEDPAKRRVLMSALRYLAHTSGASLYCTSSRDKNLQSYYRSLMNNICFGVEVQRGQQLDPSKAIVVNFGSDSLADIGSPPGASRGEYESGSYASAGRSRIGKWHAAVEDWNIYPPTLEDEMDAVIEDVGNEEWAEPSVDACRAEHDDRLVRYRREVERRERLKGGGGDGGGGVAGKATA